MNRVFFLSASIVMLVACSRNERAEQLQMVQPGVPVSQQQVIQPIDPQYQQAPQQQYQQAPQQYQQPVIVAAPPVYGQQPVIVQQQHDSTGALITGMALGSLMSSGNNSRDTHTVYRDRTIVQAAPVQVAAPQQAVPQRAQVQALKPNFAPPPPRPTMQAARPATQAAPRPVVAPRPPPPAPRPPPPAKK